MSVYLRIIELIETEIGPLPEQDEAAEIRKLLAEVKSHLAWFIIDRDSGLDLGKCAKQMQAMHLLCHPTCHQTAKFSATMRTTAHRMLADLKIAKQSVILEKIAVFQG